MNLIKESEKYFVIRLKDEKRDIYKDSEGLFNNRCADIKNKIVETIIVRKTKYTKEAKRKDKIKTIKEKREKREITEEKIGEKRLIEERTITKKNSTIKEKVYKRVITRKEVWSDVFDITGYKGKVKVVKGRK